MYKMHLLKELRVRSPFVSSVLTAMLVIALLPAGLSAAPAVSERLLEDRVAEELAKEGLSLARLEIRLEIRQDREAGTTISVLTKNGRGIASRTVPELERSEEAAVAQLTMVASALIREQGQRLERETRPASTVSNKAVLLTTVDVIEPSIQRMRHLLDHAADAGRRHRFREVGMGLLITSGLGVGAYLARNSEYRTTWLSMAAFIGGPVAISSVYDLIVPSQAEDLREEFRSGLRRKGAVPAEIAAQASLKLGAMQRRGQTRRRWGAIALGSLSALSAGMAGWALYEGERDGAMGFCGMSLALAGVGVAIFNEETPVERLVEMWQSDAPTPVAPSLTIGPAENGATLALSGQF